MDFSFNPRAYGAPKPQYAPDTSERTKGTKCDGCPCFEVLQRKTHGGITERYWCNALHGRIDPWDCKCPLDGERVTMEPPKFNRQRRL